MFAIVFATITVGIFAAFSGLRAASVSSTWNGGVGDWIESTNWTHVPSDPGAHYPHNGALTYNVMFPGGEALLPDGEPIEIETLWISGGTLLGENAALTVNQGLRTSGAAIHLDLRQIDMRGTSVWDAALLSIGPYTLEIRHEGLQELSDVNVTLLGEVGYSTYVSRGVFRKARGPGTATIGGGENRFVSEGTIECLSGTLAFLLPCEVQGRIHAAPGAEVHFDFGLLPFTTFRQTTFDGAGLILLTNGPSFIEVAATNTGTLVLHNAPLGTMNTPGPATFLNDSNAVLRVVGATELDAAVINHGQLFVEGPGSRFTGRGSILNHGVFVMNDPAPWDPSFNAPLRNFGQARFENTTINIAVTANYGTIYATNSTVYLENSGTNFGTLSTSRDGVILWYFPYALGAGSSLRGRLSAHAETYLAGDVTNYGLFYFEQRLGGPGKLYVAEGGTLAWAGDINGPGEVIIQPGGSLMVTGLASRLYGATIINESGNTLRWDNGENVWIDSGQIINRGTFEITRAMCIAGVDNGVLRNEGTIRLATTNAGIVCVNNTIINNGDFFVDRTTFAFSGAFVQNSGSTSIRGELRGQPTSQLEFLGGPVSVDGLLECPRLRVNTMLSLTATSVVAIGQLLSTGSSVIEIEIGPTGSGHLQTSFPEWRVNGTLRLRLADGFFPTVGARYVLITHGLPAIAFSRYEGLEIGGGLRLALHNIDAQLHVVVMNAPQPGQKALTLSRPSTPFEPLVLSWPPEFAGFYLQHTTNLSQPNWETKGLTWTNDFHPSLIDHQGYFRLVQP